MEEVEGAGRVREAVFTKAEGQVCHVGSGGADMGSGEQRAS